ncbi:hypothetical protein HF313_19845 [Massilia atriviolacea]|uniref:Type IV toxin-antitoxin system AbiEi family antitoxin domain-containing protein n=1 Tax=Massilia atriviolacea TaxID=2495579 RepID=A0A430HSC0_9BURK|nr:hypothetical protein [Massilia atriviolacea]RSZ60448.1 hypothetical protein EJB06_04860 [Massilia atriviolacea]
MTVLDKLRISIKRMDGQVILRSELAALGGQSQLTVALRKLIDDGVLLRMAPGVFAKAKKNPGGCPELLNGPPEAAFREFFLKQQIDATFVHIEHRLGLYTCFVDTGKVRRSKALQLGNHVLGYCNAKQLPPPAEVPQDLSQIPQKNVAMYICAVARQHNIQYERSRLDDWVEAVTRASGDDVQLDATGQILVALFKAKVINGAQMSRLMTNYLFEKKDKYDSSAHSGQLASSAEDSRYLLS